MTYFLIFVFWLFSGMLSAHFAKQRGRNPKLWFCLGVVLGLLGVFLAFFAPKKAEPPIEQPIVAPPISKEFDIPWFYLDTKTSPIGPIFFLQLNALWQEKTLTENSYVWNQQMEGWKKIATVPELHKELTES